MKILIINPNSSPAMTADIQNAALQYAAGRFEVETLPTPGAPEFIDTFEDRALAAPGMMELVRSHQDQVDAFVVACHCDPNLQLMRELTDKPVVGIGEASFYLASMLGDSFSVLSTGIYSNPNKVNLIRSYHMQDHLASVVVAQDGPDEVSRYIAAGQKAMEEDGAEVIILGCAGLCQLAQQVEQALGVPVLDGVACGLAVAEGMVYAGMHTSKFRYYSAGKPQERKES